MDLKKINKIHIIGIGGCAASAIAEFLVNNNKIVTGSELKKKDDLVYLEKKGIKISYSHDKNNLKINNQFPDVILYSPAVMALDPNNPEIIEAKYLGIPLTSWQNFIGDYLNSIGKKGITVSGSEGKGTTAGILTVILKNTEWDPLSILGAKIKNINNSDSNIYSGNGNSYIMEADEYNRNFHNYHPSMNIMINFQYEHPETYKNFDEYKKSFFNFFNGMLNEKKIIFRITKNTIDLVNEFKLNKTHKIIWFGDTETSKLVKDCNYIIQDKKIVPEGISFKLLSKICKIDIKIPSLPEFIIYNSAGAIITALELGLSIDIIKKNIQNYKGMVRRYELFKTKKNGLIITDYGHSPESIHCIINETRNIFKNKKIHIVFQPHLFSRTYNFFKEFINELKNADRISLIDIYPAREKESDWLDKISSKMLCDKLIKLNKNTYYVGRSSEIYDSLHDKINEDEVTCFIGAGDMDQYYGRILEHLGAVSYF